MPSKEPAARPRRLLRSVAAVLLGIIVGAALSLGTDQVLHVLEVYPPWGQPMWDVRLNLLALAYRCVYTVAGCTLMARIAPHSPMTHALTGGAIGFVLSVAGAVAALVIGDVGPLWYPIALALTALPCAWLGGALHGRRHAE